ncbi:MAG TPA: class I SAM-dependent methyltransferase [Bryobacteraceae bacterium]|nr:class I SAM-dependent methyltransferase [Bryobacteraceae bacterium]
MIAHQTVLANLLKCPVCNRALDAGGGQIRCDGCAARFPVDPASGIPLLFCPAEGWTDREDVTDKVRSFYEETPFPNYDDTDSRESLRLKASRGLFARLLDEQLPDGAVVLEAGCGTGQLTNFLGMAWNRHCIGSDICLNSLRLAKGFRDRFCINNADFVQMNLFRPVFGPASFDVVICNGVLHHTADPFGGFRSLTRLVKPDGFILIGLYNHIGRLPTDFRRSLFRASSDRFLWLDGNIRSRSYNESRFRAWFRDQYKHPHESKHSYDEVIDWFAREGVAFLSSIPPIDGSPVTGRSRLFAPHSSGSRLTRRLTEIEMLLKGGVDGGLYIMIGRKLP